MDIRLRPARPEESLLVLSWRNEPTTLPWMSTPEPVAFEDHDPWFQRQVGSPDCLFLIIEADGVPAGQIRFDRTPEGARVSLNITHTMHGKGLATRAFQAGNVHVAEAGFADRIYARVKLDNIGSLRALEKAGYQRAGEVVVHGDPHAFMLILLPPAK